MITLPVLNCLRCTCITFQWTVWQGKHRQCLCLDTKWGNMRLVVTWNEDVIGSMIPPPSFLVIKGHFWCCFWPYGALWASVKGLANFFNFFPNHSPLDHNFGQIFKFQSRQLPISTKTNENHIPTDPWWQRVIKISHQKSWSTQTGTPPPPPIKCLCITKLGITAL